MYFLGKKLHCNLKENSLLNKIKIWRYDDRTLSVTNELMTK